MSAVESTFVCISVLINNGSSGSLATLQDLYIFPLVGWGIGGGGGGVGLGRGILKRMINS